MNTSGTMWKHLSTCMLLFVLAFTGELRAAYWQQGISYQLDVRLKTSTHLVTGTEAVTYVNHSPDTLNVVFFHLYQNAYTTNSYLDMVQRSEKRGRLKNLQDSEEAGTSIADLRTGNGQQLKYSTDNTIMRVELPEPLFPGDTMKFRMRFQTRYGVIPRRMKRMGQTYIVAHWYPRIAVYDQQRGWNIDQHLGSEFYGDFGTFDVSIEIPAHFIVGATGVLQNRDEVLPDTLMEKINIVRFADKSWGEPASQMIAPTRATKVWRYHAENVHDFAWIASPEFRIGTAEWNGIQVYAFVRESHASGWQDAAKFSAQIIRTLSERWGRYEYPKMIVSDVNSGMEYPMLTADGGRSPEYYGLLVHEIAHNWFYGMLGSNETYRAMMDEGFTNFVSSEAMTDLLGPRNNTYWESTGNWYQRTFYPRFGRKYYRNDLRYLRMVHTGYLENPLTTHSDHFREYREYRQVYYKTTEMLYNLEYVLGKSLFQEVMQTYVERWKFRHPYPEDFIRVCEEISGLQLDWFFEEWIYDNSVIDYAVGGVKSLGWSGGEYRTRISLRRKGSVSMPLRLEASLEDGTSMTILIPNQPEYPVPEGIDTVTGYWYGWGDINNEFELVLESDAAVNRVRIDPSGRLADIYRLDNQSGFGVPSAWHFDNMFLTTPSLERYDIWLRPSFRYNGIDGLRPGIHWQSNYLPSEFLSWHDVEAGWWYGPLSGKFGFEFRYSTPVKSLGRLTKFVVRSDVNTGREWYATGFRGQSRKKLYGHPYLKMGMELHQNRVTDMSYMAQPGRWETGIQRFITSDITYGWRSFSGNHELSAALEFSLVTSDFSYSTITLWNSFGGEILEFIDLRVRIGGVVSVAEPPMQRAMYLAGGNPARATENHWLYHSAGVLPAREIAEGRIGFGGGLNLRGYTDQNLIIRRGYGLNMELPLVNPLRPWLPEWLQYEWYCFSDLGRAKPDGQSVWIMRGDAGIGFYFPMAQIPRSLGDYAFRLDLPIWLSHPPGGQPELKGRWVLALARAW